MKTVSAPLQNWVSNGGNLYNWLGAFWTQVSADKGLVEKLQDGYGLDATQLYLKFLEASNLIGRKTVPVYRRRRWEAFSIRASQRNTGAASQLVLGTTPAPVIGPQTGAPYVPNRTFSIGGYTESAGAVTYPLPDNVADIVTTIVDNIMAPNVVLTRGVDFDVRDHSIIFLSSKDPLTMPTVPSRIVQATDGQPDKEALLYASDTLLDADYVYNYMGYALGVQTASNEFTANYLNALWDLYNMGASLGLFRAGIAAFMDEPVILDAAETVEMVVRKDTVVQVVTDSHVYAVNPAATLRQVVVPGAVLQHGDLLTETVEVLDNLDPDRFPLLNSGHTIAEMLPGLFLSKSFFRAPLRYGLGLTWTPVPVVFTGTDSNGNPKLRFALYGNAADVEAFWTDFWNYCERNQLSAADIFASFLDPVARPPTFGAAWGEVAPMDHFLRNYLKANLAVVVVDGDKLSTQGRDALGLLSATQNAIPAGVCVLFVERFTPPTDTYDCAMIEETVVSTILGAVVDDTAGAGKMPEDGLSYREICTTMWVPSCD